MEQADLLRNIEHIQHISDNILVIKPVKPRYLTANSMLILNENDALLIDSGFQLNTSQLKIINEKIKISGLLFSHFHIDHIAGSHEFSKEIPRFIDFKELQSLKSMKDYILFSLGTDYKSEKYFDSFQNRFRFLLENEGLNGSDWNRLNLKNCEPFSNSEKFQFNDINIKMIDLPGHSPGHKGFFFEDSKVLFIGDLGFGLTFGGWYGYTNCNINLFLKSLEVLIDMTSNELIDTVVPSHKEPVSGKEKIIKGLTNIKRSINEREKVILEFIKKHKELNFEKLVDQSFIFKNQIGKQREVWKYFERTHILNHLLKLKEERKIDLDVYSITLLT